MNALVDTNILVRLSDSGHPLQSVCELALQRLLQRQDRVFLCAQVAIEFRAVATRPKSINGLGLSTHGTKYEDVLLLPFRRQFARLPSLI